MRILSVRFKNLNSLSGEWLIDFTGPAYAGESIFAITGPTGAGKTTILDAVCLGLYGRTPRLEKVTKSTNEIMSRHSGECYSEVSFETPQGRFRVHWSQRRARKKPGAELQPARHEVADERTGAILETGLTQVAAFIEQNTGMDFERFTRSMLLAQGGFAVFLQAPPDERSPILEQITGTEIYSRISMKVHERQREERAQLELFQAELGGIRLLSEDDLRNLQAELREKQVLEAEVAARMEACRQAVLWLESMAGLEKNLAELGGKQQDLEQRGLLFAPEGQRLQRALKALPLEGDYRSLGALRVEQDRDEKEYNTALTAVPAAEAACANALSAKLACEAALNEARARQFREAAVLKHVRELDARLNEQNKHLTGLEKVLKENVRQAQSHARNMADAGQGMQTARSELDAVHAYQREYAPDASLEAGLAAISRSVEALHELESRRARKQSAAAEAAKKLEKALADCQTQEAAETGARQEFNKAQTALLALRDTIAALLQGREISQLHEELSGLKERGAALRSLSELIERIDQTAISLDGLHKELEALQTSGARLAQEIQSCGLRKTSLEESIASLDIQVNLLCRIRDLEAERKHLEDGAPCPLCGALEHPYAKGNIPELSTAESKLKLARTELKKITTQLTKGENEHVKVQAHIGFTQAKLAELSAVLAVDAEFRAKELERLGLSGATPELQAAYAAALTGMQRISAEIALLEAKVKEEKILQQRLEKLRERLEETGKAAVDARHQAELARQEHARLLAEAEALGLDCTEARATVLKDIEPYGMAKPEPEGFNAQLQTLTARRDAWQAKVAEAQGLEKKINDLHVRIQTETALREKLERDLRELRRERDEYTARYTELKGRRRELFGERDADAEELRLNQEVDKAALVLEEARASHAARENELGLLREKIKQLNDEIRQRADLLEQARCALLERMQGAGFLDEADYVCACLGHAERETLEARARALEREKNELAARITDTWDALEAARARNLSGQSLEENRQALEAAAAEHKDINTAIGGILGSLRQQEELLALQRDNMMRIQAQKKECERWDKLHALIGSADGKRFRNFAQGLTFEMMTRHANRQLRKMTDRYVLIRDAQQPLELNVIDNYQAGEIRSTKNLSGGESFIVSLALALGLSQMASRRVRVDTLFLDEGFGTLDEEALETALETLAGLRQDGKLIGVISHVPALKERIATQIQVMPQSGGRSVLSGPGCERL